MPTFVVPVGILKTVASASFFIVTSYVLPCPVIIMPSALVYPRPASSPADVSEPFSIKAIFFTYDLGKASFTAFTLTFQASNP